MDWLTGMLCRVVFFSNATMRATRKQSPRRGTTKRALHIGRKGCSWIDIVMLLYNSFSDTCRSHRKTVYQHRRHTHLTAASGHLTVIAFYNKGYLLLYNKRVVETILCSLRQQLYYFIQYVCYLSLFDLVVTVPIQNNALAIIYIRIVYTYTYICVCCNMYLRCTSL